MIATNILMKVFTFAFAIINIVNVVEAIPFSSTSSSSTSSTHKSASSSSSSSQRRSAPAPPEASSTLLRMHRLYIQQPPHDMTLYDALQVSPNATAAEITKAYRRLSRQFHPDKRHNNNNSNDDDAAAAAAEACLLKVREAYEVLKDDTKRLPYHRYGLLDMNHAVMILTGHRQRQKSSSSSSHRHFADDPAMVELLRFVGNHNDNDNERTHGSSLRQNDNDEDQRAWRIATDLLEKIRPVIEGRISERALMNEVASECDRLKTLPMGAQILRCVGRAYRYSGRKFLRRFVVSSSMNHHHHDVSKKPSSSLLLPLQDTISSSSSNNKVYIKVGPLDDFTDTVRDKWREAKYLMTAAFASGRVLLSEQVVAAKQQQHSSSSKKPKQPTGAAIETNWNDENEFGEAPFSNENDDDDSQATMMSTVDEERIMREREHIKAMNTLLESNQVEALWKITKIEIDRTIRKACDLILQGQVYFSLPWHQMYHHEGHDDDSTSRDDDMPQRSFCSNDNDGGGRGGDSTGWVGSTGVAIDARVARQRAAAILVMMGDIMVQRSKENTSWME